MKKCSVGILPHARSLFIDHLFALLISLVITNIINFFSSGGIPLLQLISSIFVYFLITYSDSWHRGVSDGNRMKSGAIKKDIFRGFYAGLIASVPGFVLGILAFFVENGSFFVYDMFGVDLFTSLNRLWQLPLSSLYLFVNKVPALNLFYPLVLPVFSEIGYFMGLNGCSLKKYFIYKNGDAE